MLDIRANHYVSLAMTVASQGFLIIISVFTCLATSFK